MNKKLPSVLLACLLIACEGDQQSTSPAMSVNDNPPETSKAAKVLSAKGGKSEINKINELALDFDFESPFKDAETSSGNDDFVNSVSTNTTLCIVATDATLSKAQAQRVAIMAQDGFARAIRPVHTPFDGDTVFVLATGKIPLSKMPPIDIARLGMMAADCVARAIARGVFASESLGVWSGYRNSVQ